MPYFEELVKILADVVPPEHWDKVKDLIPMARVETMTATYGTSFQKEKLYIDKQANGFFAAKKRAGNFSYTYYNKQKKEYEVLERYKDDNYLTLEEAIQLLVEYKKEEPKATNPILDEITTWATAEIPIVRTTAIPTPTWTNVALDRTTVRNLVTPRRRGTR